MNKDYNSKHFHEKRKRFSPFIVSVDGMLGREALVILANLSQIVASKMDEPIFHMQGFINDIISIAVARSFSQIIFGYRILIPLWDRDPGWDQAPGLRLAQ